MAKIYRGTPGDRPEKQVGATAWKAEKHRKKQGGNGELSMFLSREEERQKILEEAIEIAPRIGSKVLEFE